MYNNTNRKSNTYSYLNQHVLQVSMYEYLQNVGPVDDNH